MADVSEQEINELHIRIGRNVKKKREEKGLSQLKLSQEIDQKSTTVISQAELGKKKHFNIEQLYKIAKVLNCDICDFFASGAKQ
ncbi:helix-turn-helix domain-containing protein [Campylobacterota bacterium]